MGLTFSARDEDYSHDQLVCRGCNKNGQDAFDDVLSQLQTAQGNADHWRSRYREVEELLGAMTALNTEARLGLQTAQAEAEAAVKVADRNAEVVADLLDELAALKAELEARDV